jgi:hypothetical protein
MTNLFSRCMLKRPVLRIYAVLFIKDTVVSIKVIIITIEENFDRFTLMTRNKIKMIGFC